MDLLLKILSCLARQSQIFLQSAPPSQNDTNTEIWADTAFVVEESQWTMFELGKQPEGDASGMAQNPKIAIDPFVIS